MDDIEKMTSEVAALRSKFMDSALRSEVDQLGWRPKAASDLVELLRPHVRFGDGGGITGPAGESLNDFVAREAKTRAYWNRPPAPQAQTRAESVTSAPAEAEINLEDIRRGMSAEQRGRAWRQISRVLSSEQK
jgi:hypothetical protein